MNKQQAWVDLSPDDERQLLISLVGFTFGEQPEQCIDAIRASRMRYTRRFIKMAGVRDSDTVIDLGSGCGFGTRAMALSASQVHACDISPAYLSFASKECAELSNVNFVQVQSRDLSPLAGHGVKPGSVDVVIAISVFIHLNLYDIFWYFDEFKRLLRPGGRVCFDFADMHGLFPGSCLLAGRWRQRLMGHRDNDRFFLDHAADYREKPTVLPSLMQWNSARGIVRVARHQGFALKRRWGSRLLFVRRD